MSQLSAHPYFDFSQLDDGPDELDLSEEDDIEYNPYHHDDPEDEDDGYLGWAWDEDAVRDPGHILSSAEVDALYPGREYRVNARI